jgi:hypothetical protein
MAFRLYIMPMILDTDTVNKPKYAATGSLLDGKTWSCMTFGFEPMCCVGANLDSTTDTNLAAQADVQALPVNLDQFLSAGAVTTAQTYLENHNLPASWVTTAFTYRQMVRIVLGFFVFFQRFHGIHGNFSVFGGGVTLDTTFGSLSAGVKADLSQTAQTFNLDTSAVTATTTIRQLMKGMSDQLQGMAFIIGGVSI